MNPSEFLATTEAKKLIVTHVLLDISMPLRLEREERAGC